jgi:hypothetical protein
MYFSGGGGTGFGGFTPAATFLARILFFLRWTIYDISAMDLVSPSQPDRVKTDCFFKMRRTTI